MSRSASGRWPALGFALALCAAAPIAQAKGDSQREPSLARQDPAHCRGQKPIAPLAPLTVATTNRPPSKFMVEVARTGVQRAYGLMCRKDLAADRGMLFVFPAAQPDAAFWMRNTLIPLDIIYIRPNGRVLSIAHARALDETAIPAGGQIRTVLELKAGRAAEIGMMPGDLVTSPAMPRG